jgi:peptidoglycan lytic transglycosylase G
VKHILILILIIVLAAAAVFCFFIYLPQGCSGQKVFLVGKGDGLNQIAGNLQSQELIRNKYFFIIYALLEKKDKKLVAGEYDLSCSMNVPEILAKISSGDRIKRMVTIIEGWTVKDIEERLNMGSINPSFEGYLFPDTYEIYPDDKIEDVVKKMHDNFDSKITPEIKEEISSQKKTLEQVVIIASILEKEVQTTEDKKIVAGILWKRMANNMPLQVDAEPETYRHLGLPSSPICNPGLDSILAAVYPTDTKYWFYLSTKEGKTIFSATLAEHERARQKYLK